MINTHYNMMNIYTYIHISPTTTVYHTTSYKTPNQQTKFDHINNKSLSQNRHTQKMLFFPYYLFRTTNICTSRTKCTNNFIIRLKNLLTMVAINKNRTKFYIGAVKSIIMRKQFSHYLLLSNNIDQRHPLSFYKQ